MEINPELSKEFSSVRFVTILTPGSFCRDMIVISTLYNSEKRGGETAEAKSNGLNSLSIDFGILSYKPIVEYKDKDLSFVFNSHLEIVNKKKRADTEVKKVR